jgi:hypothetical protein
LRRGSGFALKGNAGTDFVGNFVKARLACPSIVQNAVLNEAW